MGKETFILQQLLGASSWYWTPMALLVCLFLVLILRPERIHRLGRFKAACLLLALAIVAPSVLSFLAFAAMIPRVASLSGTTDLWLVIQGMNGSLGPILVGVGTFLGLTALMPSESRSPFSEPPRHPLE